MRLSQLVDGFASVPAGPDPEVRGLAADSRQVAPGDLFVARRGVKVDAAAFVADAVRKGAVAIVSETPLEAPVPCLVVPDANDALGRLADRLRREPSRDVAVTGVTGTNGKTTTTFLTHWFLEAAGRPATLLGTVVNRIVGRPETTALQTTPDALTLHRALAETREGGGRDLVMEVSSHALDQRRTAGVRWRCGVFTNLTRDHLDYHGTLQAYGDAKARLFEQLPPDGAAVLNVHDPFSAQLACRTAARVVRYGWREAGRAWPFGVPPEVSAEVLGTTLHGTRLTLDLGGERGAVLLPLVGAFNVENALGAAAAAWSLGVEPRLVRAALEACPGVPGRLERVEAGPGRPTVLVDYGHTPDALERVLTSLRPLTRGRLVCVFGCGGDRDRGKRPLMGRAVERLADVAVVTSDNPRSEEPRAIIDQVLAGLERPRAAHVVLDREAAIRAAIGLAGPDDVVVLAGKGHEQGQIFRDRTAPFDDRVVARRVLAELRPRAAA
jgi:UDP-N-acetylmuramoyl-L-alanyl-D-glutamate--2,6-diaminopimelate ligase